MSGFAGVFNVDGAPVDPAWLETMADFLDFRGPDGRQVWVSGNVGLCHTLFRVSKDTDGRPQIASLDGCVWIAGDVRIDDRDTLIARLPGEAVELKTASSAELILHAYAKWGEACCEQLLGDFSFVIWDGRRRQVFAARDHLGVRPLFYSRIGQCLLISNTLDCIRQVPSVSDELNEQAIGDFLLIGRNKNPTATFFSDIRRVPVAHQLIAKRDGLRTERYWNLPIDEPLYYRRKADYVDRFHELLRAAVSDRLPDGPLGIFMSGGLDSPAVAATAVGLGASVSAFTDVYDRLIPDDERYYAGLVAEHIRIPIHYNVRDDEPWGWDPAAAPIHTPEPTGAPLGLLAERDYSGKLSGGARVFFFCDGPDAALSYEWRLYLRYLIRQRRWGRLCQDLASHFSAHRRVPFLTMLQRMWRDRRSRRPDWYAQKYPRWLNPEFEASLRLKERWEEVQQEVPSSHPVRPVGHASFACDYPMNADGGTGGCPGQPPADFLHPLWDLRFLRFLLAVPAVPWCREKHLVRVALEGILPEAVRLRPKTPLAGFPEWENARSRPERELPSFVGLEKCAGLEKYVDVDRLPGWPGLSREEFDDRSRVTGLIYWLVGL